MTSEGERKNEILHFIGVFRSPSTSILFTETACYWFATILKNRFPEATIVYNPDEVHFATKIENTVYDINGIIEYGEDYLDWEWYSLFSEDADMISENCIYLKGGDGMNPADCW